MVTIDQIEALLPQTQCQRCDFEGCRPYATALHKGSASVNQCAPGGNSTMRALAALLDRPQIVLNAVREEISEKPAHVARINTESCIGCVMCTRVCPTDAIVGGPKGIHVVLDDDCTGCELCVPACPVADCIELIPHPTQTHTSVIENPVMLKKATHFQALHLKRNERKETQTQGAVRQQQTIQIKKDIQEAIVRAKAKRKAEHEKRYNKQAV